MNLRPRVAALFFFMVTFISPLAAYAVGPLDNASGFVAPLVHKLILLQFQMRSDMAVYLKSFSAAPDLTTLAPLFGVALLYGIIHAAGPGHGKAVATAYMLHGNRKVKDGVIFGNIVAFSHGLSGVMTVLFIKWVLQTRVSTGLKHATQLTSQISFSLIILLGLFLFATGIREAIRMDNDQGSNPDKAPNLLAAVAFGMVPCPGIVTIMLLAMGLDLIHLGILMALGITLGMATTISATVILVVAGKNASMKAPSSHAKRLPGILTSISGVVLTALGGMLLLGA
ncbi:hypothetical protein [Desulfoluna sp.]|uniref:HoxN/HupN/NixA family nickel/cobalt transporter n=1 Tax=Desulfoluna sp. TaxID=2045199 RepID=UPI0026249D9A|nr:hypothetical protein [Desulfoluna sp.]